MHEGLPGATSFHTWDWLHWVAPVLDCRFVPLVAERGGEPVGIVPVLLKRRGPVQTANVVPFQYLGPLVPLPDLRDTVRALKAWAVGRRVVHLRISFHPFADVPAGHLAEEGLEEHPDTSFLIDLRGKTVEEVFGSLSRSLRQSVRASARHGVVVRPATTDEVATVLPAVDEESVGERRPFASRLASHLPAAPPAVYPQTVLCGDRPVGICVDVGGRVAAGWVGSVFRADQRTSAYTAMVWSELEHAVSTGAQWFDLMGAPDPGIAAYKRRYNPVELPYSEWRWQAPGYSQVRTAGSLMKAVLERAQSAP